MWMVPGCSSRDNRKLVIPQRMLQNAPPALNSLASPAIWPSIPRGKNAQMATVNPMQFIQQVRSEIAKVVWPTRREVLLTTVMVFVMAALTAVFFALVDLLIRGGLQGVLGMFG